MPTSILELPQHSLADILRYAITPNGPYDHPQVSLVRVCSAFYSAGIPHIYRSAPLITATDSLFLHRHLPLPPLHNALHSAELALEGHTKLAALRYVQHLRIDIPEEYIAEDDEDLQMSDEQKLLFQQTQADELNAQLDAAEGSLRDLPVGCMPAMESLQIGRMERIFDRKPATRAADFAALLLTRTTPRVWCQYHGRVTPLAFPIFQLGQSEARLPVLYRHTRLNYPFSMVPGSTTYLYIHRHLPPRPPGRPLCWRFLEDPEATGRWIGQEILDTFQLLEDCLDDRTQPIINDTRVIIGGAVAAPTKVGASWDEAAIAAAQKRETKEAEGVAAFARVALIGGGQEHLKDVRIEARRADQMPPCPACGHHL